MNLTPLKLPMAGAADIQSSSTWGRLSKSNPGIRLTRLASALMIAGLVHLSGCAIKPEPLTDSENKARAEDDRRQLQADQEPVKRAISLEEALARALKYNLDFKVEMMQKEFAEQQLGLTHYDMLPRLMANLGYNARNNFQGASSRSLLTNRQSLEPSTSSDRGIFTTQVGLAWNVLDFGVAYFKAHANADKVLSREEQKRKAINRISQDVCTAYWRAVSNERLKRDMEGLAGRIASALAQSKRVMNTKLTNPTAALTYQRELLTIQRELQQLQRNLTLAKNQLAALVNLRPDQPFELAIPERMDAFPELKRPIAELERTALENRPELRDLAYQRRTNVSEARAALVAMLPGLEFGGSYNTSDNSFLWERDWWSVGSQVAWNLINLIKYPAKMNEIEASNAVLDTERLAMSMAVLTQLHVSLAQYAHAQREFDTAADYQKTQAQLLEQTRIGERLGNTSEQGLIREEMTALLGEVRRDVAYSDLENARAAIFASIGTDPLPPDVDVNQPVAQLAQAVKTHWRKAGRI